MTYEAKKVSAPVASDRAGGTQELAIEWIQHAIGEALYYGGCSEWLSGEGVDVDEDLCSDVDSWAEELVAQLPHYVEIVKLLKTGRLIAKELK